MFTKWKTNLNRRKKKSFPYYKKSNKKDKNNKNWNFRRNWENKENRKMTINKKKFVFDMHLKEIWKSKDLTKINDNKKNKKNVLSDQSIKKYFFI